MFWKTPNSWRNFSISIKTLKTRVKYLAFCELWLYSPIMPLNSFNSSQKYIVILHNKPHTVLCDIDTFKICYIYLINSIKCTMKSTEWIYLSLFISKCLYWLFHIKNAVNSLVCREYLYVKCSLRQNIMKLMECTYKTCLLFGHSSWWIL